RYTRVEDMMRGRSTVACAFAALAMSPFAAHAQKLKIVEVSAPAVNCVFETDCTLHVGDTSSNITLPTIGPGTAWLQSRTFSGQAGAPGAGLTGYEYRISLTQASGQADCASTLTVNFGPLKQLSDNDKPLADI